MDRAAQIRRRKRRRRKAIIRLVIVIVVFIALIVGLIFAIKAIFSGGSATPDTPVITPGVADATPTPSPTPEPTPTPIPDPSGSESTNPDNFGFKSELQVNGASVSSYAADEADRVYFDPDTPYTAVEGVVTFRGNNFRTNPAYGKLSVTPVELEVAWNITTGSMGKGEGGSYEGSWTGSGWTGQPILVHWPAEIKQHMNMTDEAKADDDLVEAIYATMDGCIYFINAETGEKTRSRLNLGVPFKGAGSLDPRGYPILYLGSGDHYNTKGKESHAMALSLLDCSVLYRFGKKNDDFTLRSWHAYDSSALVDAETDTLIYPGENGILYRIKLNTQYDAAAGTLTMNPDTPVKMRYSATRTREDGYWLGYEGSAVGWREYVYLTDNSGLLQCVNVNTMSPVWVQDILDDTNATPAFEEDRENLRAYLYVGTTLDNTKDKNGRGNTPFFKIDALTGEIIWQNDYEVYTTSGVTGGMMSSPVLGENNLEGIVYATMASYGNGHNKGIMLALDTETGAEIWSYDMGAYAWSSPVAVYDDDGKGYIVQCNRAGNIFLFDGLTGTLLYTLNVESNIEASPAVYGDMIVIGTRVKGIYGIRIK